MGAPQQYDISLIGVVSIDSSLGPTTYVLPKSPGQRQALIVKDWNGHASTNPITIVGVVDTSSGFRFDQDFQSALLVFNGVDWSLVDTANGPAGGDLGGQFPNPLVRGINGHPLGSTTPTSGNLLLANGSLWQSEAMSGDATITFAGLLAVTRINGNPLGSTLPTSGNLLIANGSLWQSETMTGDATISSSGLLTVSSTHLSAPLPLAQGGTANTTGQPSGSAGGDLSGSYPSPTVAKINGGALGSTTPTSANLLIANGSQWQSVAMSGNATINSSGVVSVTGGSGTTPGGGAGGDLGGTYPNPTVAKINGNNLGTTTPTAGNLLVGSGSQWASVAMSGGATINASGAVTVIGGTQAETSKSALGSNSATGAMLGLKGSITPTNSGTVIFIINGTAHHGSAGGSFNYQIRYGTGAAPNNGDALTGTAAGLKLGGQSSTAGNKEPFGTTAIVAGLSVGTAYWYDISLDNGSAGTATVDNIIGDAWER